MPEEIVTRILRVPGYGVYAWAADEATSTLTLSIRQTAREPYYVCGGCGIVIGARDPQLDGTAAAGSALGDLGGVAARGGASRALPPLWGADRAAAVRSGQGPRHGAAGGGRGRGL